MEIGGVSYHCVCGEEFNLAHGTATTETLIGILGGMREKHKIDCKYWELAQRDHNFRESLVSKQALANELPYDPSIMGGPA